MLEPTRSECQFLRRSDCKTGEKRDSVQFRLKSERWHEGEAQGIAGCSETSVRTAGTYTPQAATAEMKEEKGQKEEDTRRKEEQTRSKPGE